jgi:GTP-binding protein
MLMQVTRDAEKVLLLRGGRGGLGNQYFRKGQVATLREFTSGKKGEEFNGFFELQLQTDVVFIGLPNAGKSSMLNALSNASVKVGSYPFTTLTPHLAKAGRLTLLDLPGLIEGTTEGKGLGTRFMKHAKSARLVAHFLSLESDDLQRDYDVIRKELELIDPALIAIPELIILTKKDLLADAEIKKRMKQLKTKSRIETASVYDYDGLRELLEVFKEMCK